MYMGSAKGTNGANGVNNRGHDTDADDEDTVGVVADMMVSESLSIEKVTS